jgi:hypothetical protein
MLKKIGLWTEWFGLFVIIPGILALYQQRGQIPFFPILLGMFGLVWLIGRSDPAVELRLPPNRPPLGKSLKPLLGRILVVALFLFAFTAWRYPELWLRLPREKPRLWVMILILYPLLSVAPQEVLFRSYFMQRYIPLFGSTTGMLIINAIAFAWAHALFLNWIAPILSLFGGLLIAHTWQRTKDFRLVCIEHALYGQLVFTSGIGWFFYTGSAQALEQMGGG